MTAPARECQPEADALRQHTPTPWAVAPLDGGGYKIIPRDDPNFKICRIENSITYLMAFDDAAEPDAKLIVEAVNNYERERDEAASYHKFWIEEREKSATLQARVNDRDHTIDLLEANARVQAKLLADTGRRVDELTKALDQLLNDKHTTYAVRCMKARETLALPLEDRK